MDKEDYFNNLSKWKTLLQNVVDIEFLLSTGTENLVYLYLRYILSHFSLPIVPS